jgi:hypothetical protein
MNKDFLQAYSNLLNDINSIKKNSDNPYFKSKYADLNAIFDEIKEKIRSNGFVLLQSVEGDTLITQIVHIETGEELKSVFNLITKAPDMQQLGSAVTYARRYSLLPMLNLEVEDDDGNLASGKTKTLDELKTVDEFINAIKSASSIKYLGALYYKWSAIFSKGTPEYNTLQKTSGDMRLKLENPEMNVEVR